MKRPGGFTLMELMLAIAIAAILAVLALPAYRAYAIKAKLSAAFGQLKATAVALNQYAQDTGTYVGACSPGSIASPPSSPDFVFSCDSLTATTFLIRATGNPGTTVAGFVFTLDQNGNKATPAAPAGWPTSPSCWIKDSSGDCA